MYAHVIPVFIHTPLLNWTLGQKDVFFLVIVHFIMDIDVFLWQVAKKYISRDVILQEHIYPFKE